MEGRSVDMLRSGPDGYAALKRAPTEFADNLAQDSNGCAFTKLGVKYGKLEMARVAFTASQNAYYSPMAMEVRDRRKCVIYKNILPATRPENI